MILRCKQHGVILEWSDESRTRRIRIRLHRDGGTGGPAMTAECALLFCDVPRPGVITSASRIRGGQLGPCEVEQL